MLRSRRVRWSLVVTLALAGLPAAASGQSPGADSLFAAGRLAEAPVAYAGRLRADPADSVARARAGLLALWANELPRADSLLGRALAEDPTDRVSLEALAEARYRQGRFREAAPLFQRLGRTALAAKLAALPEPYAVSIPVGGTRLQFAPGAVLPVVEVAVNGHAASFLVDTGAGETIIDPAFAASIGARTFGPDSGEYAGGKVGSFEHGTVDSLELAGAVVRGVPVHLQGTTAYAPAAGGRAVSGILGTGVLSRLRSTLDFAAQALELRAWGNGRAEAVALSFWLLGDHFVTTTGAVGGGAETLLVFDTGLAMPGGAIVPSESLLEDAGIVPAGTPVSGVGGGGAVTVTPFLLQRLTVGPLARENVLAVAGAFPPSLERRFGARIGGLLSHGFFADRRVTMDFASMRLIVEEPPH